MIAWFYIVIASCFEVCWIFSLKALDMKRITQLRLSTALSDSTALYVILPLIGYIVFGVGNIYFFSQSMKVIPAATAFAVWMGLALIFSKAMDILYFHQPYNVQQLLFTGLILIGIIGLKWWD